MSNVKAPIIPTATLAAELQIRIRAAGTDGALVLHDLFASVVGNCGYTGHDAPVAVPGKRQFVVRTASEQFEVVSVAVCKDCEAAIRAASATPDLPKDVKNVLWVLWAADAADKVADLMGQPRPARTTQKTTAPAIEQPAVATASEPASSEPVLASPQGPVMAKPAPRKLSLAGIGKGGLRPALKSGAGLMKPVVAQKREKMAVADSGPSPEFVALVDRYAYLFAGQETSLVFVASESGEMVMEGIAEVDGDNFFVANLQMYRLPLLHRIAAIQARRELFTSAKESGDRDQMRAAQELPYIYADRSEADKELARQNAKADLQSVFATRDWSRLHGNREGCCIDHAGCTAVAGSKELLVVGATLGWCEDDHVAYELQMCAAVHAAYVSVGTEVTDPGTGRTWVRNVFGKVYSGPGARNDLAAMREAVNVSGGDFKRAKDLVAKSASRKSGDGNTGGGSGGPTPRNTDKRKPGKGEGKKGGGDTDATIDAMNKAIEAGVDPAKLARSAQAALQSAPDKAPA